MVFYGEGIFLAVGFDADYDDTDEIDTTITVYNQSKPVDSCSKSTIPNIDIILSNNYCSLTSGVHNEPTS